MKFILLVGSFAVFSLSFMMVSLQAPLFNLFTEQVTGLKYHDELLGVLTKACKAEIFILKEEETQKDELHQLLNELEMDFSKIKSNPHYMENKMLVAEQGAPISRKARIPVLIKNAIEHWEKLKKEIKVSILRKNTHLLAVIENIIDMIDENRRQYYLDLNLDRVSFLLINALVYHIPHSQALITKILAKTAQHSNTVNSQASIIEWTESLKTHLQGISEDVKGIFQDPYILKNEAARQTLPLLVQYQESLEQLITLLETTNFGDPMDEVAFNGERSWKLGNMLGKPQLDLLRAHIQAFIAAINTRQKASLAFVILASIAVLVMFTMRIVRKPLENLKIAAQQLEKGNLSIRVPISTHDEVAFITGAFNKMAAFFEKTMFNAKQITLQLVETTSHILDLAKQLEANVTTQEKTLHQLSVKAKGISQITQNFNTSLKEVNKIAGTTFRLAALGQSSLKEMEAIMQQMAEASKNIVTSLGSLKNHIGKINTVITTILKIADQSNLLSLNTAIKASKTGIKGVGFSVVAEKIRELADQTADATLDIEQAVQEIVAVVSDALVEVDHFSLQIRDQVEDEKKFNEQLKKLINSNQLQIKNFENINLGIEDQFKEANKISQATSHLEDVSHATNQSLRKLYNDIEFLHRNTYNIREIINKYHISENVQEETE